VLFTSFAQTARSVPSFLQSFRQYAELFDMTFLIAQPADLVLLERFAFVTSFMYASITVNTMNVAGLHTNDARGAVFVSGTVF
jgi:hypothetical protein